MILVFLWILVRPCEDANEAGRLSCCQSRMEEGSRDPASSQGEGSAETTSPGTYTFTPARQETRPVSVTAHSREVSCWEEGWKRATVTGFEVWGRCSLFRMPGIKSDITHFVPSDWQETREHQVGERARGNMGPKLGRRMKGDQEHQFSLWGEGQCGYSVLLLQPNSSHILKAHRKSRLPVK